MGVRAALAVLLLFIANVMADEGNKGNIEIWREEVTLTCPQSGKWFMKGEALPETEEKSKHNFKYDGKSSGHYYCEYEIGETGETGEKKKERYHFYVKAKVCENCFELDSGVFGLIIVVDVIGTAVVMMIIYKCTKKKDSTGSTHNPKPNLPGTRPPPTPSPDYEQLNPNTRAQGTYSTVNRTG